MSVAVRELIHLKEQREHLRYLLTRTRLCPDYRLKFESQLARLEKLISEATRSRVSGAV
jgi:hypothetical protein